MRVVEVASMVEEFGLGAPILISDGVGKNSEPPTAEAFCSCCLGVSIDLPSWRILEKIVKEDKLFILTI